MSYCSLLPAFQSTLPRGSDSGPTMPPRELLISIHAPSRERRGGIYRRDDACRFQSTLPRGSDRMHRQKCRCKAISIHAPSRERPKQAEVQAAQSKISIHAPSRERPAQLRRVPPLHRISIHAPSRERLHINCIAKGLYFYFNPRSLAGATFFIVKIGFGTIISIHAPSRERPITLNDVPTDAVFQSTLPRGSDLGSGNMISTGYHFNPRSLAGATDVGAVQLRDTGISIHAPSRERRDAVLVLERIG